MSEEKYLTEQELAAFNKRLGAIQSQEVVLLMMREGSSDFVRKLSEKYGVPSQFQINPRTGLIVVAEKNQEVTKLTAVPPSGEPDANGVKPVAKKKATRKKKS